jgi:hypothetical protein
MAARILSQPACGKAEMRRWRKVRRANIPDDVRQAFEKTGQFAVAAELNHDFPPAKPILRDRYPDGTIKLHGREWIREQIDRAERREDRLETVEWAILIFVVVGVVADCLIVAHELGCLKPN